MNTLSDLAWCVEMLPVDITMVCPLVKLAKPFSREQFRVRRIRIIRVSNIIMIVVAGNIEYTCPVSNNCEINKRRRKACQACR